MLSLYFLLKFIYLFPLGLRIETKYLSVVHKAICGLPVLMIHLHLNGSPVYFMLKPLLCWFPRAV